MNEKLFPQKQLVIASHNAGKVQEIRELLLPLGLNISSAFDHSIVEPEETETTFEGNALLKARAVCRQTHLSSLADDSGLVITALGGDPGVYSARWAGETRDFNIAIEKIKEKLNKQCDVKAYFVCVLALVCPDGTEVTFRGTCHGHLQFPSRGNFGFGYDPIFVLDGQTKTFGEMHPEEKKQYSHRTHAFKKFLDFLECHNTDK